MVECERVTSCGEIRVSTQALVVGLYRAIKAANGTCSVREAKIAARAIGATFSNTDAAAWLSDVNAPSDLPRAKSGRFEPRGPQPDRKEAAPTDRAPDHGADRSDDDLADRITAAFTAWFFDESMRLEQRSAHYQRPDVRRKKIQEDLKAAEVLLDNPIEELQARARRFLAARDTGDVFDLEATVRNLLRAWDWGCVRLSASERQAIAKRCLPPERPGSVVKTISASERR